MPNMQREPTASARDPLGQFRALLPGVALCLAVAAVSYVVNFVWSDVSPLIVAIVIGILVANFVQLPAVFAAGVDFSAKKLLRAGIVLLGLRLVLTDVVDLGLPMVLVIVAIVTGGFFGTVLLGRLLRVPPNLALLVACGFSICGAAAVAGAASVTDPDDEFEEDTITAVALVVLFGTLMIPLVPLVSGLLELDQVVAGRWAGGSIHEIAQVVAAGGILGGIALAVGVVVKLARVLLLAPVITVLSLRQRRLAAATATHMKLPPIVPVFVLGFLAMVVLRTFVDLPAGILTAGLSLQTVLLAAAMFGLGTGVRIRKLLQVGGRPFALAGLSTILVAIIAYSGVILVT